MLKPNFNLENVGDNPTFTMPGNIMDIHEEPDYSKIYDNQGFQQITGV